MEYDFERLDGLIRFNYKNDLYSLVKSHGSQYVSECVYTLYNRDKKSVRQTAAFMEVSPETILYWMRKWNFSRRPQGGNVKNDFLRTSGITRKIMSLKGQMTTRAAAAIIGCCPSTIRTVWKTADSN